MKKNRDLKNGFIRENSILKELTESSDRSKVILGSAILEELLERLLKKYFISSNENYYKNHFESSGFLSSFSSKVNLSYMLGLISKELYEDLEIIRNLRNKFAHMITQSSLSDQNALSLCNNFNFVKKWITTDWEKLEPSTMFIMEIGILEVALVKKISRSNHLKSIEFEISDLGFEKIDHDYLSNENNQNEAKI